MGSGHFAKALIARLLDEPAGRELTAEIARALGWTTGPSKAGWKVVEPYGTADGMVSAPPVPSLPAEVWFDPQGRERGGPVGRAENLPPWLSSLDAALSAAPKELRGKALYHALSRHAAWQLDHGTEDPGLFRLPAFVMATILEGLEDG